MVIKGRIYGIYYEDDLKYIGSTTYDLNVRLNSHISKSKTRDRGIYKFIRDCNHSLLSIEELELFICETKQELLKREGEYILKHFDNILNKKIERGYKYGDGRWSAEKIKCSCGYMCRRDSMYDHLKTKRHSDFLENPVLLQEFLNSIATPKIGKMYEVIECECGCKFQRKCKSRHLKSKLHNNLVNNKVSHKN